jgi:hypothetical protein
LTETQKASNKEKSSIRVRVEHVCKYRVKIAQVYRLKTAQQ